MIYLKHNITIYVHNGSHTEYPRELMYCVFYILYISKAFTAPQPPFKKCITLLKARYTKGIYCIPKGLNNTSQDKTSWTLSAIVQPVALPKILYFNANHFGSYSMNRNEPPPLIPVH